MGETVAIMSVVVSSFDPYLSSHAPRTGSFEKSPRFPAMLGNASLCEIEASGYETSFSSIQDIIFRRPRPICSTP